MTMSDVSHTQKPENVDTREQKTTDREPSVAKSASTAVDHPAHYNHGGGECIDVARRMPFCLGNALKYIWRCGHKHDGTLEGARRKAVEDAQKAVWYLNEFIKDAEAGAMDSFLELQTTAQGSGAPALLDIPLKRNL